MDLRDYQEEAVRWLVPRHRGFIKSPAGSGKTIIGACALAFKVLELVQKGGFKYTDTSPSCLVYWLANTIEQCQQAVKAIEGFPGPQFADVRVCCAASMPDLSKADVVIFDEAHHCPAETWMALILKVRPDAVLWGFSATPFGDDPVRNLSVTAAFKEFFSIDRSRLEEAGHLMKGRVFMHDVDQAGEFDAEIEAATLIETRSRIRRFPLVAAGEHYRRAKWQATQKKTYENQNRNLAIISNVKEGMGRGASVLLLVSSIEHGTALVSGIPGAALVHSKVGARARRGLIQAFREGSLRALASSSLADEGLDVPRASMLVLAAGGRSSGKLEQRAGRVLRPFAGKTHGTVHDFLDRGASFAYAQAKARMRTYEALGYNPEIVSYGKINTPVSEIRGIMAA